MGGALLQLKSTGSGNIYLNGSPSKTFFKGTYAKYTNFALQKFRVDFAGSTTLHINEPTLYKFKIPRYGELLMDTYLALKLPDIWSPFQCISRNQTDASGEGTAGTYNSWYPYEFKWIKNLGTQIIKSAEFYVGGILIQKLSGDYLYNLIERDFDEAKKNEYYKMTGNIDELNDPANAFNRVNTYPSAFCPKPYAGSNKHGTEDQDKYYTKSGCEPSIRGRYIYIPLNIWSTLSSKMSIPLVSMQYSELEIQLELRPVKEWFVVKYIPTLDDISDMDQNYNQILQYYHQANPGNSLYGFWIFLNTPPHIKEYSSTANDDVGPAYLTGGYTETRTDWNSDVHLISTYVFLDDEEQRVFAATPQQYLVKEIYEYEFNNIHGSRRLELDSTKGLVSSWMWFFRRTDAHLRNEWTNYTNWPYEFLPYNIERPPSENLKYSLSNSVATSFDDLPTLTIEADGNIPIYEFRFTTGYYNIENQKNIMSSWALLFDGKYRENSHRNGIYSYIEKYNCSKGNSPDGLYNYNFCLDTNPFNFQPTGACNLSKFHKVEFEVTLNHPPLDREAQTFAVCDGVNIIGVNKPNWRLYEYNYDMIVMEERYNIITFEAGIVKLMFPR